MTGDNALLQAARTDPEAFATFYRRHVNGLLGYFLRRTANAELAADLTAETFAAALDGCDRFDPARGPAVGWLYGIARRLLSHAQRRGVVEDRARRRLGMPKLVLDDEGLARVEARADAVASVSVLHALYDLPAEQRSAIEARVLNELSYDEIASKARTSPSVVRKRVSRGLNVLRTRLDKEQL